MTRWILGLSFLAGCAADAEIRRVSEVDVEAPRASAEREAPPVARPEEPPPSAFDSWHLPGATEFLGAPCDKAASPAAAGESRCGTKGRVAIEQVNVRSPRIDGLPCTLRSSEGDVPVGPYSRTACAEGDHLVIVSTCVMCRIMTSATVHARLSELDAEQHAFLRRFYGMEGDGPASPEAWRALVAQGKPVKGPGD